VEQDGIVGLSIGVAVHGELVYAEGFGFADLDASVLAEERTIYDIASAGKHFTAAAILRLIEQGRLSLDDRAKDLIPELPDHFPDATVDQLLRHTSGFVGGELDELHPPDDYIRPRYGLELLTDIELANGRALFGPDETWVYCNPGYLVLGMIVEVASGMRYDAFVREELLARNGLTEMTVCRRPDGPRMSVAYHRTESGVSPVPFIDMTAYSGQGSICSSVVDLLRWSDALNTGRVVSPGSLRMLRSASVVRGEHVSASIPYGMAQRLGSVGPYFKVGHTGTFDGGSAALAFYPKAGLEIAVLTNTRGGGTPHAYEIETAIAKRILGVADPDVSALRKRLDPDAAAQIEGRYTNGDVFEASIEGDTLVVRKDGKEIERLLHIGGLRFRNADAPDMFEWFILDGERAGWWVYSVSGNFLEVLRREPE